MPVALFETCSSILGPSDSIITRAIVVVREKGMGHRFGFRGIGCERCDVLMRPTCSEVEQYCSRISRIAWDRTKNM